MGGSTIKINYFNNKTRSNFCLVANHSMTMAHRQFDCYMVLQTENKVITLYTL